MDCCLGGFCRVQRCTHIYKRDADVNIGAYKVIMVVFWVQE